MRTVPTFGRIYRLKLVALVAILVLLGLLTAIAASRFESTNISRTFVTVLNSLSDVLLVTGALGLAVDFFTGREKDAADSERTRAVLKELTPDFTDAVVRGLAVGKDDLSRVATPELLDSIATNVMALRLRDDQFAAELYGQVRDLAIRAPERWYDVTIKIRLSSALERSASGAPLFDILIEWEYTTVPSHGIRKFACVSDRDEYYDLVTEVPATSTWFMPERTGVNASDRSAFELLEFTVDGKPRTIRRSTRKTGQTYTVTVAPEGYAQPVPVRLRQVYRTVGAQDAHRLFVEPPVPARDVKLDLDYSDTEIVNMAVSDTVTSLSKPLVTRTPERAPGHQVGVELSGWLLPRSGFTFVWTLSAEQTTETAVVARSVR